MIYHSTYSNGAISVGTYKNDFRSQYIICEQGCMRVSVPAGIESRKVRGRDLGFLRIVQINSLFGGGDFFFEIWFRGCFSLVFLSEMVRGAGDMYPRL